MHHFRRLLDWPVVLKRARREAGLSQAAAASRAGISAASVRAYEAGVRHPSEQAVHAIARGLGLPRERTAALLASAGYASRVDPGVDYRYVGSSLDELREELAAIRWPAFVTNQAFEVVAMNAALPRLFEVERGESDDPAKRNLMSGMSDTSLAGRLENWEELALFMIGLAKGDPRRREGDEHALPWLEAPMAGFLGGDPARIRRFMDMWESAPAITHRLRHVYAVKWRGGDGGVLSFRGTMTIADLGTEMHFNEWIPEDATTWAWLDRVSPA